MMDKQQNFQRNGAEQVRARTGSEKAPPMIFELTAKIEPFDSFWEAPEDIEKGYASFYQFYKHNYLKHMPSDKESSILVISCGPGYFVNLLNKEGYRNVLGIDSNADKIRYAKEKNLNCRVEEAFPFLAKHADHYDVIFCEQELNHLTKAEILIFLQLCRESLCQNGTLIVHVLNGANPITGAEALAQNFDHYNTFTEYTLRQVMDYVGFHDIKVIPLNLYVFYKNPLNYVLILLNTLYTLFFRISFMLYGKSNKIFTKKIAAICKKPSTIRLS
jgi:2-polyprenyl-3-methyl-5-hydroxy-6-metoxy-1,4-benzoquinol methylase